MRLITLVCVLLFSSAILITTLGGLASPSRVYAQNTKAWSELNPSCVDSVDTDVATLTGIQCIVQNTLTVAVTFIGLAAFIMFIVGSFLYLTSGGNPKGTEAGQKTITFAIIGVVVSLTGFVVLNFLTNFTGVKDITTFSINSDTTTPP